MKGVIVFESMFGNTAALAGEVMSGLADADAGANIALADVAAAAGALSTEFTAIGRRGGRPA